MGQRIIFIGFFNIDQSFKLDHNCRIQIAKKAIRNLKIIGIDTGSKGCIVELNTEAQEARYLELPYRQDKIIDFDQVKRSFDFGSTTMIFLEYVRGRSGWGATQMFTFGCNYGQILGFLYDKPHTLVGPKTWQKIAHCGCLSGIPKLRSRESFQRLNPQSSVKKSQDGLIDAFHIARYGLFAYHAKFRDPWEFTKL